MSGAAPASVSHSPPTDKRAIGSPAAARRSTSQARPFIIRLDETRKEWLRWNGEGEHPTIIGISIYENATLPERDELGDLDQEEWDTDRFSGERRDPWQIQYRVPLVSCDQDATIYELTSRSRTAINAFQALLRQFGRAYPQRKKGLVPLVQLSTGSYFHKELKKNCPKPDYKITGWVQKDGSAPPTSESRITTGEMNDEIPF
jgi:hypothetical protein